MISLRFLSLLKVIEPETGDIYIDGVIIQTLRLKKLRKNISLIPQDLLIFNGSIKDNLDQYNQHSDEYIKKLLNFLY